MHRSFSLWRARLLSKNLHPWMIKEILICIFLFSIISPSETQFSDPVTCAQNLTANSGYWYYSYVYGDRITQQKCSYTLQPTGELAKKKNLILTVNFLYFYKAIPTDHIQFPTGDKVLSAKVPNFAKPDPSPDCYHIKRGGSSCKSVIADRFCSAKGTYNIGEKDEFVFNVQSYIFSFTIQFAFFECEDENSVIATSRKSPPTTTKATTVSSKPSSDRNVVANETIVAVTQVETAVQHGTAITSIILGCLLALVIIILIILLIHKKCRKRMKKVDLSATSCSWEGNSMYTTRIPLTTTRSNETNMTHQQQCADVQDFPTRTPPPPRANQNASLPRALPRKATITKSPQLPPFRPSPKLPPETDAPYLAPLVNDDEEQTIYAEIPAQTAEEQAGIVPAGKKKPTIVKPPRSKMNRAPSAYCAINVRKT